MARLSNSWKLFKISWGVLRSERSLVAFPVLAGVATVVVAVAFGALIGLTGIEDTTSGGSTETGLAPIGYVFIVLMYLALAFVVVYFQSGLTAAADRCLRGERTSVGEGLREANTRIPIILAWAAVVATVNLILRAIEERFGFVGTIVAALFGGAWAIVTFLAVPIVVLEHAGPVKALKRSGSLLRQTWGENILGQAGFGIVALVAMLPAIALGALAIAMMGVASIPLGVIAVLWTLVVAAVVSAVTGIYRVALYRYAVDHVAPAAFADIDFEHAFTRKKKGSL